MQYVENLPWWLGALITVIFSVLFGFGLLLLIRRTFSKEKLKASHDVVGFAYGVVGMVYAVLLGFNVVNVQERFNTALRIAEQEANCVADLYRDAAVLPAPYGKQIQVALQKYIELTLKDEWSDAGKGFVAESVVNQVSIIWQLYYQIEPMTEREKMWMAESISKLNEFTNIRLQRVYNSHDSLGNLMWTLLYIGAFITISFLGFFWVDNFKVHILVISLLSALIGFMLYLIQALDSVYTGSISIRPEALESVDFFLKKWN